MMNSSMPDMRLTRLAFLLRAESLIRLPRFSGSAFRGGFGSALRRACCTMGEQDCRQCMLGVNCVYASVFETASNHASDGHYQLSDYPRPFIIEPPYPVKGPIEKGQSFVCHLVLMGDAVDQMPYFVYAFSKLGQSGLGTSRGKFGIEAVAGAIGPDKAKVFDGRSGQFVGSTPVKTFEEIVAGENDSERITLNFSTPTRIKDQERLTKNLKFDLLTRSLLRRATMLVQACKQRPWNIDHKRLLEQAGRVQGKTQGLRWLDWKRYSSRQKTEMRLGGFLGSATYEGNLTPFLPFLRLGEYLHIGKACTFGLGKYEIVEGGP